MIIAVIPALNEEATIGSVVLKTKRHVDKVIVIDDGSKDKTSEIAQLAGAEVAQHTQNKGKGEALNTGFEIAEKLNADLVVCLDADGQHNPDDIPKVIAPILSGEAEMVIGSRYLNTEYKKDIPKYRRLGLWILTKTINFGSKLKTTDSQCGFRAFSGNVLENFKFRQKGLNVESEMLEDAIDNNINIKEVPISTRYEGLDTSTEKPGKHGFSVLNFILRAVRERHPLLFFGLFGAILLIIGLALAVFCLDCYFTQGFIPFGPSLAASVLLLIGTLGVFAGLILDSISGMIRGLRVLSRSQEKKLLEDVDEQRVQNYKLLSPYAEEILYKDINESKIYGVKALRYNPGVSSLGDINGQKILGLSFLNNNHGVSLLEEINGHKMLGPSHSNHNHEESLLEEINGQRILGLSFLNHYKGVGSREEINGQKTQGVPVASNHREEILHKKIDDENNQI